MIRIVKVGLSILEKPMTKEQAFRYGQRKMPSDLKRAGFKTIIFESTVEINGSLFYRVNYGMSINH